MTRLILIRHGETRKNVEGKTHDFADLEKLTPHGIDQMKATGIALEMYAADIIYCSKETRANESAQLLAGKLGLKIIEMEGLGERNWGDFAGLPFDEIKLKTGLENMPFDKRFTFTPPNGESWKEVEERLLKALYKIIDGYSGKTIVLVTHGGSIRTLIPVLLGVDRTESYKYDPDNASITVFDYDGNNFLKVIYNDTSHLTN
jgi:broad specificity phosphatase PhoE